ncbi:ion transporter [Adhaeribacter rhizoryzae]|uniref:Ion transporter n=1 Tax=Adhaeribacter rhizoryzae TaxID=2607907 RepID=A0A5M6DFJ2_9BACT|nr:ion transporter [Adhaeribacter rhizoryzae]KAA5543965.1 ion transporter [Adhaeribacter rhizoryzae]
MRSNYLARLRTRLYPVVFQNDTFAGKLFDVALLVVILLSVITVILESVSYLNQRYFTQFRNMEWVYTILFTLEYLLRVWVYPKPKRYIFSFFGLVDLISVLPTYLSLFILGTQYFLVVRVLRLLRIARIFKLTHFLKEGRVLTTALRASLPKILVFIGTVMTLVIIIGSVMYVVEGAENGFTSIPKSIYWAIVTLTTVGYGDIAPQTPLGQFLAGLVMLLGYGIIAIPTGIVTVEIANVNRQPDNPGLSSTALFCSNCLKQNHEAGAKFCNNCGSPL